MNTKYMKDDYQKPCIEVEEISSFQIMESTQLGSGGSVGSGKTMEGDIKSRQNDSWGDVWNQ